MRLLMLDPLRALHDYWRESSPETHLAIGGAGFGAWAAQVNWGAILAFGGLAVMTIGGVVIQLYKQWRIAGIEIEAARNRARPPAATTPAR